MIVDIIPIPSRMVEPGIIRNWRGGHLSTNWGQYVELSAGRDVCFGELLFYKILWQDQNDFIEYVACSKESLNVHTLLSNDGMPVKLYPVIHKRIRLISAGASQPVAYYYVNTIRMLLGELKSLDMDLQTLGDSLVPISFLDFVTMFSMDRCGIENINAMLNPMYCYDIQPVTTGEVIDCVNFFALNDESFGEDFTQTFGEYMGVTPSPTMLMDYYAVRKTEFNSFTLWLTRPCMSNELRPHLSPKYHMHLWSSLGQRWSAEASRAIVIDCSSVSLENFQEPSALERIAAEVYCNHATDLTVEVASNYSLPLTGSVLYANRPSKLTKAPDLYGIAREVVSDNTRASLKLTKSYLEALWIESSIGSLYCIDLLRVLITSSDLVNPGVICACTNMFSNADSIKAYMMQRSARCMF